jgi:UDP-N-acetylglucosamine 2-epimerase (non-hydrolysing)
MKLSIILGTRPEIIKMAPVIRECEKRKLDYFILHTGQHYSYNMDKIFFEELNLSLPKYNLEIGSHIYGRQLNLMINGIQNILKKEMPDIVLVLGDTNTVLAGALAAHRLGIKIGHIESGLRSYEIMMEEINRVLVGLHASYHFAPTRISKENLLKEGIEESRIFITGNTIVDSLLENINIANNKYDILKKFNLEKDNYILVTLHRPENVDNKYILQNILKGLELTYEKFNLPIIFSVHPRTRNRIKEFNLKIKDEINIIDPQGYLEFLQLMANSRLIITDSGGLQEESCVLKVPCVTIREVTERPESIEVGSNILAGYDPVKILECSQEMMNKDRNWENPFGDGKAGKKIIDNIINIFKMNYKFSQEWNKF